jgi:hypothetical protein
MDLVRRIAPCGIAALLCSLSSIAVSDEPAKYCGTAPWQSFIEDAATRVELPAHRIDALVLAESAGCEFTDGRPTTSTAGAMGLTQIMPATWERFRQRLALGHNPYDPHDNILAGAAYLRELYDRYGWPGASAAYHAGPARYDDHLMTGQPLPQATLDYLARMDRWLARMNDDSTALTSVDVSQNHTDRALFVARTASGSTPDNQSEHTTTNGLFVTLRRANRHVESKSAESTDVQEK